MSEDTTLWAIHVQGGDEWHAEASKEDADAMAAKLDEYDRLQAEKFGTDGVYLKPLVKPWPFSAEAHAAELAGKDAS